MPAGSKHRGHAWRETRTIIGGGRARCHAAEDHGARSPSFTNVRANWLQSLRVHHAELTPDDAFAQPDTWIDMADEPDHQELCNREQRYFLRAIHDDLDMTNHLQDAVNSLRIAFACDESVRTGEVVRL